jgi:hypothetical protein
MSRIYHVAQILLPVYASISGFLELTNQFALVVDKHLVLLERGTIVTIVGWCTAIIAVPKKQ